MLKKESLVITGHGAATAIGCESSTLMSNMRKGATNFKQHPQLEVVGDRKSLVAYVDDESLSEGINVRILRKLDRFSLLAMQAFQQTYHPVLDKQRVQDFGLFIGNTVGGWTFVEPQMDEIYQGRYDTLSPYVATAWFPTAPQGEISIQYKISGYSKTFSADALSVGYALDHACYLIEKGYLPGAFVGGVDAPLSPLVYNGCIRSQPLSASGRYLPFHKLSDGYLLGEGAGFLMIEPYERLLAKGEEPLGYIAGMERASTLSKAIKICLENAEKRPNEVDCIFLDAKGDPAHDQEEYSTLEQIFEGCKDIYLTTTKTLHGSLLAADFAIQLVIAILSLVEQTIPRGLWSKDDHKKTSFGHLVLDYPVDKAFKNVLLYTRNLDGSAFVVLVERSSAN